MSDVPRTLIASPGAPVEYASCPDCGFIAFPVPVMMFCGHSSAPDLRPLEEAGALYSWSRSWDGEGASTAIGLLDFFDGRLRVTAPLAVDADPTIGDRFALAKGDHLPYPYRGHPLTADV